MFGPRDDEKEDNQNLDEDTSSEDTSEDEDTSQDDSDDSSNDGDDSDDGKDEEDRIREIMSDPRKLPKELQPIYKRMQTIMTKRIQAAKESTEKAEALDILLQDPDIRELIESKRTGKFKAKKRQVDEDDDSDDDEDTTSSKKLESMIRDAVTEALNPVLTRERQSRQKEQQKEFEAFTEKYPDWEMYKEDMYEIIKGNSNLSFVQAYRLAKSDYEESSSQKKLSKEELLERKKKLNTRKPNSEGSRGSGEEKKKKMTIWDAFKLAKKQSGYKG